MLISLYVKEGKIVELNAIVVVVVVVCVCRSSCLRVQYREELFINEPDREIVRQL